MTAIFYLLSLLAICFLFYVQNILLTVMQTDHLQQILIFHKKRESFLHCLLRIFWIKA